MPSPVSRRLLRRGLVAAAVVLLALGAGAAFVVLHAPGNVSHPNLEFTAPTTSTTSATTAAPAHHRRGVVDRFVWPWYGFDAARTHFFAGPAKLRPPLHVGWRFFAGGLLEFPPVIYHQALFLVDDNGSARALSTVTGRVRWQRTVGTLAAVSPAVAAKAGLILVPVLSTHGHSPGGGRLVALSMKTGRVVWARPIPAGSESSPIVSGHTVYFGDQGGTLRAMDVRNGHLDWTYRAAGAIKAGPALVAGVLFFGDYAGRAYAVRARDGHQVWSVGTDGAHFGFGSGQFYSTPAVAYGRVYMGNTDGRVYSFGARNGALAWATATGSYVYASPAVADPPGLGPTVYAGSYDGHLYAFNAQSGSIRWAHPAGGRISGSATVVGRVVYYSDLGSKTTTGLDAVSGRTKFSFPDGAFTPVIADYQAIYLDGYNTVYQLLPGPRPRHARTSRHRHKARRHRHGHRAHARRGRARQHRRAARSHRRVERHHRGASRHHRSPSRTKNARHHK